MCVAELMRRIGFSSWAERYFPKPGSNRGYGPAEVVTCWMLMLHEGARSLTDGACIYRALATNRDEIADSEIVHWYNQRGEDSENRIKELKCDFADERLPCGRFEANALYFHLCVTAYNLFVLFRHSLPPEWHTCRAPTLRWRVYALAAKVVCHARRVYLKFRPDQARLVKTLLAALAPPERPPPLPGAA